MAIVEGKCPFFLVACLEEILCVVNVQASTRPIVKDAFISDSQGRFHLLK
jgi:hypothetical protein